MLKISNSSISPQSVDPAPVQPSNAMPTTRINSPQDSKNTLVAQTILSMLSPENSHSTSSRASSEPYHGGRHQTFRNHQEHGTPISNGRTSHRQSHHTMNFSSSIHPSHGQTHNVHSSNPHHSHRSPSSSMPFPDSFATVLPTNKSRAGKPGMEGSRRGRGTGRGASRGRGRGRGRGGGENNSGREQTKNKDELITKDSTISAPTNNTTNVTTPMKND